MKDELAIARVNKSKDNRDINPSDLLQCILNDIESGTIECNLLFTICAFKEKDGSFTINYYRCNVDRTEEVALLEMAKHKAITRWENN